MKWLRAICICILVNALLCNAALGQKNNGPPQDLRVTIIAVTDFEDPSLRDSDLIAATEDAAKKLKSYFERQFGISPDLFTTAQDTSADALRTWLFQDLPLDSRKAVHLIFLLTHGFAYKTPDQSTNKNEVFFATSDTYSDRPYGRAIRGSEFIEAFQDMPKWATAFFFADSCGSGAIDGENLQKTLQLEPEFGSRVMVLASAMSDESAYRARFTRTLADLWESPTQPFHCGRRKIESFLTSSLKSVPGVSTDVVQSVRVVAPLNPDFCIESFGQAQRLLFLFNAAPGDVSVSLVADDGSGPEDPIVVHQYEAVPVILRKSGYTMVAKRVPEDQSISPMVQTIDFRGKPVDVEVLFSSDPLDQADAGRAAAQYLEGRRIYAEIATTLQQKTAALVYSASISVQSQMQRLDSEALQLSTEEKAVSKDLERSRKEVEIEQQKRNQAMTAAQSCETFPHVCTSQQVSDLQNANLTFEAAVMDRQRSEDNERLLKNRTADLAVRYMETNRKLTRSQSIKNALETFAAKQVAAKAFDDSLVAAVKPIFENVHVTERGVVTTVAPLDTENTDRLGAFTNVLNRYSDIHVEIEFIQSGRNSVGEQTAVRAKAAAFRDKLKRLGLKSRFVVARGFVSLRTNAQRVDMIMSPGAAAPTMGVAIKAAASPVRGLHEAR